MPGKGACIVCQRPCSVDVRPKGRDINRYDCRSCGEFGVTGTAQAILNHRLDGPPRMRFLFSHTIRKMNAGGMVPELSSDLVEQLFDDLRAPPPHEQALSLLLMVGSKLSGRGPQEKIDIDYGECASTIGALGRNNAQWVVSYAHRDRKWLDVGDNPTSQPEASFYAGLTFEGWREYYEQQRKPDDSRLAFMAMSFRSERSDDVRRAYLECFKPAVQDAGFELRTVDERPRAGLIDAALEVEIRRSRFLVVDLTDENRGAYWEAGFGTGLGRPVIYTCEKSQFEKTKTHFDTEHHQTVQWTLGDWEAPRNRLAAIIRTTLPSEAKLQ